MQRLSSKILLSLAVAGLTGLLAWPFLRDRGQRDLIDYYEGDGRTLSFVPGAEQVRTAPPDGDLPPALALERPLYPPSTFQRWPIAWDELGALFPIESDYIDGDPFAYYVNAPDVSAPFEWLEHPDGELTWRTNSLGLREDEDVSLERPDLRVLVLGDSHTAGLCNNDETYSSLLEQGLSRARPDLSIDVLNAGKSGYSFQHYLGTLERLLPLRPDAIVVGIYAGNDFEEGLELHHLFHGSEHPPGAELYPDMVAAAKKVSGPCFSQSFQALKYFSVHPGEREVALQMARDNCIELAVNALRHSTPITFVVIPPPTDVEWQRHAEVLDALQAALAIPDEDLDLLDSMTSSLVDFLRLQGLDVVDLRSSYRAAQEPLYWAKDNHINLRGQALVAEALLPRLEPLLERAGRRVRRDPTSSQHDFMEARDGMFSPGAPPPEERSHSALYREP